MRPKWWQMWKRFSQWRAMRRKSEYWQWREEIKQAENWTALLCNRCGMPASCPDALFCAHCGMAYYSGPHTDPTIESVPVPDEQTRRLTPLSNKEYSAILAAIKAPTRYEQQLMISHQKGERLAKTAARLHRLEQPS